MAARLRSPWRASMGPTSISKAKPADEIAMVLKRIGMTKYVSHFAYMDMRAFIKLTEQDLTVMGIGVPSHQVKIVREIEKLKMEEQQKAERTELVLRMQMDGLLARRTFKMKNYPPCFVASEAVDWLVTHPELSRISASVTTKQSTQLRQEAVAICQAMLDQGLIYDLSEPPKSPFEDKYALYTFEIAAELPTEQPRGEEKLPKQKGKTDYNQLFRVMFENEGGVVLASRRYRLRFYDECFVGAEAVDWLLSHYKISRLKAVNILQKLFDVGYFVPCDDGVATFVDGYEFYRIKKNEAASLSISLSERGRSRERSQKPVKRSRSLRDRILGSTIKRTFDHDSSSENPKGKSLHESSMHLANSTVTPNAIMRSPVADSSNQYIVRRSSIAAPALSGYLMAQIKGTMALSKKSFKRRWITLDKYLLCAFSSEESAAAGDIPELTIPLGNIVELYSFSKIKEKTDIRTLHQIENIGMCFGVQTQRHHQLAAASSSAALLRSRSPSFESSGASFYYFIPESRSAMAMWTLLIDAFKHLYSTPHVPAVVDIPLPSANTTLSSTSPSLTTPTADMCFSGNDALLLGEAFGSAMNPDLKKSLLAMTFGRVAMEFRGASIKSSFDEEWTYEHASGLLRCSEGDAHAKATSDYLWDGEYLYPALSAEPHEADGMSTSATEANLPRKEYGFGRWNGTTLAWLEDWPGGSPDAAFAAMSAIGGDEAKTRAVHYFPNGKKPQLGRWYLFVFDAKEREYVNVRRPSVDAWKWTRHFLASKSGAGEWIVEGTLPEPIVMCIQILRMVRLVHAKDDNQARVPL